MMPPHATGARSILSGTRLLLTIGAFCGATGAFAENAPQANPYEGRNPYSHGSAEYREFAESQHKAYSTLQAYRDLSTRFNRELAGRYPFGPMATGDVDTRTVCDFFRIHEGRIESIRLGLDSLRSYPSQVWFLNELAPAGKFLAATACSRFNQPVRILFRPEDTISIRSNPPRVWKLTDDFGEARFPHGIPHLDWRFGAPIALEVTWAEHTGLRPRPANTDDEFETPDTATVRFGKDGDWALMRFIDAHGRIHGGFSDDTLGVVLAFSAPLIPRLGASNPRQSMGATHGSGPQYPYDLRTPLTIRLVFENFQAGRPRTCLKWPKPFPTVAPLLTSVGW